jgi:phospholipid/cholesterol/gamma-HCH transport system ATP-binding protein
MTSATGRASERSGSAPSSAPLAVELSRVTKRFGTRTVLAEVSVQVRAGTGFCILGRSGTGKSVILKHIVGLIKPDEGRVFVEGIDITPLGSRELVPIRRRIGFLFQSAALFDSLTVGENVAFPLRRHTDLDEAEIRARVARLLADVGLAGEEDKFPGHLSGGMRKRVGLARALALDPPILLADEPSAGLDPVTAEEIDSLLLELKRRTGKTLILVTHNMLSAKSLGDEFAFLHDGRILVQGRAPQLEACPHPLVQAFLRSQATG